VFVLVNDPVYWSIPCLTATYRNRTPLMSRKRSPRNAPSDPHARREAERYEHPIASREAIMEALRDADAPLLNAQLATFFGLSGERDEEALRRRLRAMQRDGQLHVDRRGALRPRGGDAPGALPCAGAPRWLRFCPAGRGWRTIST
jgi:hypothetical protein